MTESLEILGRRHAGPVRWGEDDCAHFCASIIRAATGDDLLDGAECEPPTESGAVALLEREGGLARAVLRRMRDRAGWRSVAPCEASPPALGIGRYGPLLLCCVSIGRGWWVSRVDDGVTVIQSEHIKRAWQCRRS